MGFLTIFSKLLQITLAIIAVYSLLSTHEVCRSTKHVRSNPSPTSSGIFSLLWPSNSINDSVSDVLTFENTTVNSSEIVIDPNHLFSRVIVKECLSVPLFGRERNVPPEAGVSHEAYTMFLNRIDERLVPVLVLLLKGIVCIMHMLLTVSERDPATASMYNYAFFIVSSILLLIAIIVLSRMYMYWGRDWVLTSLVTDYPSEWTFSLVIVAVLFTVVVLDFIFSHFTYTSVHMVRHHGTYRPAHHARNAEETNTLFASSMPIASPSATNCSTQSFFVSRDLPTRATATRSSFNVTRSDSFRRPAPITNAFCATDTLPLAYTENNQSISPPQSRMSFNNLNALRSVATHGKRDEMIVPPSSPSSQRL